MKIVQINATCGSGSTGKICVEISKLLSKREIENCILFASRATNYYLGIRYTNPLETKTAAFKSRVLGNWGFNSNLATNRLIRKLDELHPDIVHLHNMHGHNCNLDIILNYLKEKKIKVIWTFHDCWLFTGYCMHYDMIDCNKWKYICEKCPQCKEYSWFWDRSKELYLRKKRLFEGMDLTIVTPSKWLANQVEQSFLKGHSIKVINNGIDLSIFKQEESNYREKYDLGNKFIVLGVAFDWGVRKGLDVFVQLSKQLSEHYKIVLVGTDDIVDKTLPENIIPIHRTENQQELAKIYSMSDVFVNPTREENYPTVNMEAIACGTPVITFNTGGSSEIIDEDCGVSVEKNDIASLKNEIIRVCETKPYTKEACFNKAKKFDMCSTFNKYIDLYEEVAR